MRGLSESRWAPKHQAVPYSNPSRFHGSGATTTTTTTTEVTTTKSTTVIQAQHDIGPRPLPDSYHELARYTKIVRRLKWKLPYLAAGYHQAINRVGPHVDQALVAEANIMFKIDFHEYYMLLERALVHLLGVFGITVSRNFSSHDRDGANGVNGSGYQTHRYHCSVLEALDNPENPIHPVLGTGEVRRQLWRAKDLRNRWKNVDDSTGNGTNSNYKGAAVAAAPLESYDLERMLSIIFDGFDLAFHIADRFVSEEMQRIRNGGVRNVDGDSAVVDMMEGFEATGTEEQQWEFMVEAMDWEAV